MRKLLIFFCLPLLLLISISCEKEDDVNDATGEFEYMIFGHFYGECGGENCVEIFRFDMHHLEEDTLDTYPNSSTAYTGAYVPLSNAKYELVKDLVDSFPMELYDEPENVLGQPDAGDWGGAYVEIKYVNDPARSGFWLLDQNTNNMPMIYNDFVARINEKILLIHQ